jgi:threonine dehydrogenase-like Zn-dependent dehydrogenase
MKAVRCHDHKACVREVSPPSGEGVRVRVKAAGICGSDLHMIAMGWDIPVTLGHEVSGIAEDGTPVALEPTVYCGHCEQCLRGAWNLCRLGPSAVIGVGRDGGMAEEVIVPARNLVPLPASVAVGDACLVEPLSVAVRGLALAKLQPGQRVAVVGGGTIGLCAVAMARRATPHVHLHARHASQKRAGEILGATLDGGQDCDLAIDCAGSDESLRQCVALCKPGAAVLLLATYWHGLTLPATEFMMKELRLVASMSQARSGLVRDVEVAASAMATDPRIARTLITHRLPIEAAQEAFAIAADRASGAIKVSINP